MAFDRFIEEALDPELKIQRLVRETSENLLRNIKNNVNHGLAGYIHLEQKEREQLVVFIEELLTEFKQS